MTAHGVAMGQVDNDDDGGTGAADEVVGAAASGTEVAARVGAVSEATSEASRCSAMRKTTVCVGT